MINFSIDYLTRKDASNQDSSDSSPRTSPAPCGTMDNCAESSSPESSSSSLDSAMVPGEYGSDKPPHSYIALISMAILNTSDKKVLLGDIYQYIMDKFPYYNNKQKAWRNSIRHNLSLNECFIKSGKADNGKGNFWSIHPACIQDFSRGDFRRRQARRRARKSTMSETNVRDMSMRYRCNIGYVPMTSSVVPYSQASTQPYFQPSTPYTHSTMTSGSTYPSLTSSATPVYTPNVSSSYQNYFPSSQNSFW